MLQKNLPANVDAIPVHQGVAVAKREAIKMYKNLYKRLTKGYKESIDDLIDLICYIDLVENEQNPINELDARKLFEFLINK